jgi:hypothetical protein
MPKQRYERREPTHEWSQIRPLLKDPMQIHYEILRPIVLFGVSPKERSGETGVSKTTLYAKANLFDQAGMASLLPPTPPPEIPKQDKRTLPPPMRQAIVDAHAEYPGLSLHEIARICYVQFNRKPSHHTIQLVLAEGPSPSRSTRRFPRFDEIADPAERRRVIIRLHAEGWMPLSIAEYLGTSRQTVHTTLRRWAEEQFAGLEDKPHTRKRCALKTDLRAMNAVKRLQENPELGAYRIHTALLRASHQPFSKYLWSHSGPQSEVVSSANASEAWPPEKRDAIQGRAAPSVLDHGHSVPGHASTRWRYDLLHLYLGEFFTRDPRFSYLAKA